MLKKLLIILCLTSMFCIQINALANPTNTPNTQQGAVDQETQSKYETLRNSLIPKQEDFIQHSKNLTTWIGSGRLLYSYSTVWRGSGRLMY